MTEVTRAMERAWLDADEFAQAEGEMIDDFKSIVQGLDDAFTARGRQPWVAADIFEVDRIASKASFRKIGGAIVNVMVAKNRGPGFGVRALWQIREPVVSGATTTVAVSISPRTGETLVVEGKLLSQSGYDPWENLQFDPNDYHAYAFGGTFTTISDRWLCNGGVFPVVDRRHPINRDVFDEVTYVLNTVIDKM